MQIYVKKFLLFPYFLFFGFHTWFYQMRWFHPYCSFKHSMWWHNKLGHIYRLIFNTELLYSCAHFVVEIDENSSNNGEFSYDLMTISYSGLLFWATLSRQRSAEQHRVPITNDAHLMFIFLCAFLSKFFWWRLTLDDSDPSCSVFSDPSLVSVGLSDCCVVSESLFLPVLEVSVLITNRRRQMF